MHRTRRVLLQLLALGVAGTARAQITTGLHTVGAAGDVVTCTRGHRIARLNRSLYDGEIVPISALSDRDIDPPETLDDAQPCPRCGTAWMQGGGARRQIHLANKGWVPN